MMGQILSHREIGKPQQRVFAVEDFAIVPAQGHAPTDFVNHGAFDKPVEAGRDFRIVAHLERNQRGLARSAGIAQCCKIGQTRDDVRLAAAQDPAQRRRAIGNDRKQQGCGHHIHGNQLLIKSNRHEAEQDDGSSRRDPHRAHPPGV